MQKKELNTPDTTDGHRRWSLWYCLMLGTGILATGILLLWIGDGFPPLAWRQFTQLLSEHAPSQPQFALVLGQLAFLVAAWGFLLILTVRSMYHVWQHRLAVHSKPRPGESHLRGHMPSSAALASHAPPLHQAQPDTPSKSLPPQVNRVGGQSPPHEDHARDVSPPLQVADVRPPSPVQPFQPALFGDPMQFTVGSCSDEGMQHELFTTAYLLTEVDSENGTSPSLSTSLFAVVDRIPADEPGYTRSCLAIETMRDTVIHACTPTQPVGNEALATLLGEHVQQVTHIIGQHSQGNEAYPAIAAALVVGSQLFVANNGETHVYLYRSREGLSQLTATPGLMPHLAAHGSPTSRHSPHQNKRKQHVRGSGTSHATTGHASAVPLVEGDIVLLCSDGVWSVLHAAYLEHIIRSAGPDPSAICAALLLAVRKSGGTDPVCLIVVHCHHQHDEHRSWQETLDVPFK